MVTAQYGLNIVDVDKTNPDDQSCMAAAMANAIASSSHQGQAFAEALYNDFMKHFKGRGVSSNEVWEYIFAGELGKNIDCEAKYYNHDFFNERDLENMGLRIMGALYEGWIVIPGWDNSVGGHAITVYGFQRVGENIVLSYVDSDDAQHVLRRGIMIKHNNLWHFRHWASGWVIIDGYSKVRIMIEK